MPGKAKLGRYAPIFSPEFEVELVSKVQEMEKALFGLSAIDIRRLAFGLAEKLNIQHNFSAETGMAERVHEATSPTFYPHTTGNKHQQGGWVQQTKGGAVFQSL